MSWNTMGTLAAPIPAAVFAWICKCGALVFPLFPTSPINWPS
jgi:hypothetical protein